MPKLFASSIVYTMMWLPWPYIINRCLFLGETPPRKDATNLQREFRKIYLAIDAWGCAVMHAPRSEFCI